MTPPDALLANAYPDARPFTRWWWFSGELRKEDIRAQLAWLEKTGFGGVEIAWIYPLPAAKPGPRWLSEEWTERVAFTKHTAQELGLGCDFTFGSLWPFGGSSVTEEDASRTYRGLSDQRLRKSWEEPHAPPGYILNHLDRKALARYAEALAPAFGPALAGKTSALFCDSWEVGTEGIWTEGFGDAFRERFGYDLLPYMDRIDEHPDVRYDYRTLLSDTVIEEFYRPLHEICRKRGAVSRVQCHGAPCDLLDAYACPDVPESEAVLFDPPFSLLAASAAALAGKPLVSAETFTCLYGWTPYPGPSPHQGEEQIADLKLLADALFANGVNFIVWHGMPFNPPGSGNRFYASVHVGPDGALARDLPAFNGYLARVSGILRRGFPLPRAAVYLPLEDERMKHELPRALRRPSGRYHWELHERRLPPETEPYRPLWVTLPFLRKARVEDGELLCGETRFPFLYVDATWLSPEAVAEIRRLAQAGLPVCLKRKPARPGRGKSGSFEKDLARLVEQPGVMDALARIPRNPLVEGKDLPEFWCRRDGEDTVFFFAHPKSRGIRYPMKYGQSACRKTISRNVRVRLDGRDIPLQLDFAPNASLAVRIDRAGKAEFLDFGIEPSTATSSL